MTKLVRIQLAIAVPLILAGGFFVFFIYHQLFKNLDKPLTTNNSAAEIFYSKLDGTTVEQEDLDIVIAGVMIENHVDARPQSGLTQARVVYEVLAESDITRFLAIYDLRENLEKIGPVRSARPYYIDLAGEYQAVYVHSGGSPAALTQLKGSDLVINLDEFFGYNTGYFWRDTKRYAPHNLYTSSELLLLAKEQYGVENYADFITWKFKDGQVNSDQTSEIKINFSEAPSYQVVWRYLKDTNKYERWQNNSRHIDDLGNIVEADNVIVQYAPIKILDEVGRKAIGLVGRGRVVVFRDGLDIEGSWQKDNLTARTLFYDLDNNEIELNRGKIWIEVVSDDIEVDY